MGRMNGARFDVWVRRFASAVTRRGFLKASAGIAVVGLAGDNPETGRARQVSVAPTEPRTVFNSDALELRRGREGWTCSDTWYDVIGTCDRVARMEFRTAGTKRGS